MIEPGVVIEVRADVATVARVDAEWRPLAYPSFMMVPLGRTDIRRGQFVRVEDGVRVVELLERRP